MIHDPDERSQLIASIAALEDQRPILGDAVVEPALAALREVAYETVLLKLRRIYHAQVADWLVVHIGERVNEHLGLVAEHFLLAGQNELAGVYFERAGKQALRSGANQVAQVAYWRALDLRTTAGERNLAVAEDHIRLGEACWHLGMFESGREDLLGRQESVAMNLGNLASAQIELNDRSGAWRSARESLRLSHQLGALPRVLQSLQTIAEILFAEGKTRQALVLMGLVHHHPSSEYQLVQEIDDVVKSLAIEPTEIELGFAADEVLDLETVVAELLAKTEI